MRAAAVLTVHSPSHVSASAASLRAGGAAPCRPLLLVVVAFGRWSELWASRPRRKQAGTAAESQASRSHPQPIRMNRSGRCLRSSVNRYWSSMHGQSAICRARPRAARPSSRCALITAQRQTRSRQGPRLIPPVLRLLLASPPIARQRRCPWGQSGEGQAGGAVLIRAPSGVARVLPMQAR